ncbi:DUF6270 domain-containing protein [Ornithinimicrobium faecis]|uniref:DUF6270 domain-containing protein n=1 Tax=Ornithinimicrobium faecis TaxID=2934158 RepID=A0ABY4YSS9_9MICO|nr:DUF6270 domain-containing protein [Ornithinimicrobium sp. HY1793]USQ79799.1 DUF6270 domain-containing protein [Ornithinimicrobium sp. HY1793]
MSFGVYIFGSCVSRDTVTELGDDYHIVHYTARQSAISAGRPAQGVAEHIPTLSSPFQDRVVRADIRGDLFDVVRRKAGEADIVLLDLVDERFGVIQLGGGYVTRLVEFWSNGGQAVSRGAPHLVFGSDEHFALWSESASAVVQAFQQAGLAGRLALFHTPWTTVLNTGEPLELPSWMPDPDEMNAKLRRYVRHYASLGVHVITMPKDKARSTREHRWGPSPFHYTDDAHGWLAQQVAKLMPSLPPR